MGKLINRLIFIVCLTLPVQQIFAQSGIGIGTSSPNPNAALDIQSAANDKGILIPRLTSTERLAMNATLSSIENGLLVFDSELQEFFYWNNTIWTEISVIQDLQLVGNSLSITKNSTATVIDLSPFSGTNTDNQNLSSSSSGNNRTIDITGGTSTSFNVADNDNNIGNELQTISKVGSTVTLSNGGGTFTDAVNDADASTSNELQTIAKAGATVTLSNGGGSFVDDDTDADADPANEIQTISKAGSTVTLSNGGGTFTDAVNDADASTSNELQTIAKAGATVTLSNGGGSFVDDDTDADADPANEIQTISKAGSTVTLSNGGGTFTDAVNDADASTSNELQTIAKVGATVTLSNGGGSFVDDDTDADADPANEIQTISKSGSTVTLSNGGGTFTDAVNDADASAANEIQTLSVAGSSLTISSGNTVTLPSSSPIKEAFKAHRKTSEAFVKGIYQLPFESIDYDLNGTYNPGVGDYKAIVDGVYYFNGTLIVNLSTPSFADLIVVVNGSDVYRKRIFAPGADIDFSIDFATDVLLAGGDTVQLFLEIQGGNFNIIGGRELTNISGRLVVEL